MHMPFLWKLAWKLKSPPMVLYTEKSAIQIQCLHELAMIKFRGHIKHMSDIVATSAALRWVGGTSGSTCANTCMHTPKHALLNKVLALWVQQSQLHTKFLTLANKDQHSAVLVKS